MENSSRWINATGLSIKDVRSQGIEGFVQCGKGEGCSDADLRLQKTSDFKKVMMCMHR